MMRTDPPAPPSPPEGPPFGTNFSRRKATHPLPPSPALTRMVAWSINVIAAGSARGVPTDYTCSLGSGLWALGSGLWALGSGLWALGSGEAYANASQEPRAQ